MRKFFAFVMFLGMAACWPACARDNPLLNSIHQDWSFIQKAGGMEIGEPKAQTNGEYFLPMKIDVSGKTAVTRKPESTDSPFAIKAIHHEVKGNRILFWVETCFGCIMYPNTTSDGILIGKLEKGLYKVQYVNNDGSTVDIRTVEAI